MGEVVVGDMTGERIIHLHENQSSYYLCGEEIDSLTLNFYMFPSPRMLVGKPEKLREIEYSRALYGERPVCQGCADVIYRAQTITGAGLYG